MNALGLLSHGPPVEAPARPAAPLTIGATLAGGRFTILRKLGQGGMGMVYAAHDRERAAEVALKTLIWADAAAVGRMKHEFRALADVVHPNLVGLQELFFEDGRCFFTMDLVEGRPLTQHVRGEGIEEGEAEISTVVTPGRVMAAAAAAVPAGAPRSPSSPSSSSPSSASARRRRRAFDEAALRAVLPQLVAAVDAIHRAGKLHRDLKPANVLVTGRGEVMVLDFGLVRDQRSGTDPAAEKGVCGTPHYMAPEQAAGSPARQPSDWYAVGVMLYEALTGQLPFRGAGRSVMVVKQNHLPPSPREVASDLPDDLVGLCTSLLSIHPDDRPTAAEILDLLGEPRAGAAVTWSASGAIAAPLPLFGRERPLARLRDTLALVRRERRTAWVHVQGWSGFGKSALLDAFAAEVGSPAGGGALVLAGRCYERESVPFKALDTVVEALAWHLMSLPREDVERLTPADLQPLVQLFPSLRFPLRAAAAAAAAAPPATPPATAASGAGRPPPEEDGTAGRSPPGGDARQLRRRASQAFIELFARLADRAPVVVVIDDLQWSDVDSARLMLELLGGMAARSAPAPAPAPAPGPSGPRAPALMLVTAYRSDEAAGSPALQRLRHGQAPLADQLELIEVQLDRLEDAEAHALATALLRGASPVVRAQVPLICGEAAGSPLLIGELARHALDLEAEGRTLARQSRLSLGDLVRARVDRLDPPARALFEVVCVSGRPVSQAIACAAAGHQAAADGQADAIVRRLRAARLVRVRTAHAAAALDVYHDRIRESALAELDEERARRWHRALAAAYAAAPRTDPEALARHHAGAGHHEQAGRFAEAAGELAEAALAFDRAAQMFRMALELAPRDDSEPARQRRRLLTTRLARVLSDAGRGGEAAPLFMAAADGAPLEEAIGLRRRAAEQWLVSGHTDEGMTAYRQVLDAVGLALPETPRAALLDLLRTRALLRLRGMKFTVRHEDQVPAEDLVRIDACKSSWSLSFVNTIQGAAFQAKYLLLALRAGEPYRIALGLGMEAIYNSAEGGRRHERTRRMQQAAQELAATVDNPHLRAFMLLVEGQVSYLQGSWRRSSAACEKAERILVESGRSVTWELTSTRYFWGNALVYQGRWREVGSRIADWRRDAEERNDLYAWAGLKLIGARSATLAGGDVQAARREVAEAMERWRSKQFGVQSFLATISLVQLDLHEGKAGEALARVDRMWPAFGRSLMTRIQVCRVPALQHDALAALAVAGAAAPGAAAVPALLRRALADARRLRREDMPWSRAIAGSIEATVAHLRGDQEAAARGLEKAVADLEAVDQHFHAAAARRRLGELVGGDRGRALIESADGAFRRQGVLHPGRLAAMMAPGFRSAAAS